MVVSDGDSLVSTDWIITIFDIRNSGEDKSKSNSTDETYRLTDRLTDRLMFFKGRINKNPNQWIQQVQACPNASAVIM